MKKLAFLSMLLTVCFFTQGQLLKKITDKAKQKADEKVDKKVDDAMNGKKDDKTNTEGKEENNITKGQPATLKSYSKYDFVPGEKIIVFEDFMQDAVGDFPAKWNTNASGDIVTIEGMQGHWLRINKQGVFMPEFIDSLADDVTFEFDLLCDNPGRIWSLYTNIVALDNRGRPETYANAKNRFTFTVAPGAESSSSVVERRRDDYTEASSNTTTQKFTDKTKAVHVAVWRQKERVRVYFDEEKVWDMPKAIAADAKPNAIVYWLQGPGQDASYFLSNLRLAVGAPDTRKKILEQNKWVTHGILFDVNSATIKPESYGTIKEMATVLKENPDLKVKIVGHTDADGSDVANLDLSKKRSASVKDFLVKEFGIDESRMTTDGKGEGEPIDKNDTPAGKANNRRVEFIKI
jgi:outer membrane protein OmpA-like peptidoglycan-associated protein